MAGIEAQVRAAITALRELDGRRVAAEEGMPVDHALRCFSGAAGVDVATLRTAAEVLSRLPATEALFHRGGLAWGHVRQLVVEARGFDAARSAALDAWVLANGDRLAAMDVEARTDALDHVLRELTARQTLERREERAVDVDRLTMQLGLDGSSVGRFAYGPESTAALSVALDAEADQPLAAPCPTDTPPGDVPVQLERPSRPQQLAAALLRLVHRGATTGRDVTPRTGGAPTRLSVTVDLDRVTDTTAGTLRTALRGRPARLTAQTLDRLSCDAALDLVVRDGHDLLAAQRYAPDVTAAVRRAVVARDGGCRWPTCTAPVDWCDVHHVTPRAAGGDHAVTNLVLLCRRHHTAVHRRSWANELLPDGTYRLRRRGRTVTSTPRDARQLDPPDPRPPRRRARPDLPRAAPPPGADPPRGQPDDPPDPPDPF